MIDRPPQIGAVGEVLERAKQAAIDYNCLTGKPLGIVGEVVSMKTAAKFRCSTASRSRPRIAAAARLKVSIRPCASISMTPHAMLSQIAR